VVWGFAMTDAVDARMASLRKSLKRRRFALAWLPWIVVAAASLPVTGVYLVQANMLEAQVKADYQETWCETFGASKYNAESKQAWFDFIDRNRQYLESRPVLMHEDGGSGERYLGLEFELQTLNVFDKAAPGWIPLVFSWAHDELASGKNEFGKAVPLPCS
jgi:hypothetical protein